MSKSKKAQLLSKFIAETIEKEPFEHDGAVWAKVQLKALASDLGISERTVQRMTNKPPFSKLTKQPDGETRYTLLRIGDDKTPEQHQKALAWHWKILVQNYNRKLQKTFAKEVAALTLQIADIEASLAKYSYPVAVKAAKKQDLKEFKKRRDKFEARAAKAHVKASEMAIIPKKEYGCLKGLIDVWGPTKAPDLLTLVVENWSDFMTAVECHKADTGEEFPARYLDYPSITVTRRFWPLALDVALTLAQKAGTIDPQTSNGLLVVLENMKGKLADDLAQL